VSIIPAMVATLVALDMTARRRREDAERQHRQEVAGRLEAERAAEAEWRNLMRRSDGA
jgi:hypothetical protein